jgi:hypothetical protein
MFIYLFNDTFSTTYVISKIMHDKVDRKWKEGVAACFKILKGVIKNFPD